MAKKNTPSPVHQIRMGSIKAAIWENQTENGTRHQTTFQRSYQVDGEWKTSTSFGLQDLALLQQVAALAVGWVHSQTEADEA